MKINDNGELIINFNEFIESLSKESMKTVFKEGVLNNYFDEMIKELCQEGNCIFEDGDHGTSTQISSMHTTHRSDEIRKLIIESIPEMEKRTYESIQEEYDIMAEKHGELKHENWKLKNDASFDSKTIKDLQQEIVNLKKLTPYK